MEDDRWGGRWWGLVALVVAMAIAAQGGCVFVSKTVRTERTLEVQKPPAEFYGRAGSGVEVSVGADGTQLVVQAVERGVCTRSEVEIIERRVSREADFEIWGLGSSDTGYVLIVWVLISPITLLVSGVATGISVSSHDDEVTRERRPRVVGNQVCTRPVAGRDVSMVFPRGSEARARTDARGRAALVIPPGEPEAGSAMVSVDGEDARPMCYGKPIGRAPGEGCVVEGAGD